MWNLMYYVGLGATMVSIALPVPMHGIIVSATGATVAIIGLIGDTIAKRRRMKG